MKKKVALASTLGIGMLVTSLSLLLIASRPLIVASLLLILLAVLAATAYSVRRGYSLFDPAYVASAAFFLLFFLRPLYDLVNDRFYWISIDVDPVMTKVMVAALVAVVFFYVGLFSGLGERLAVTLPPPAASYSEWILLVGAFFMVGLAAASRVLWAYYAGGFSVLWTRRESVSVTGANIPLFAQATNLVIPAAILFLYLWPRRWFASSIGLGLSFLLIAQTIVGGDRRYALTFVVVLLAYLHISRKKVWRLPTMALLAVLGIFLFVGPVEMTRGGTLSYPEAVAETVRNPFQVVESLFLRSLSTSMLNAFGIVVTEMDNGNLPFRYGLSASLETVLQPVPREVWSAKPLPIRSLVIDREWGMEGGRCVSQCPTFSSIATFYSDLGVVGVALGTFISGIVLAIPRGYVEKYRLDFLGHAMMSSIVLVPFMLWWGALSSLTVALAVNLIPLIAVATLARKPRRRNVGQDSRKMEAVGT